MKKRFTLITAALMMLTILAVPIGMWGQTRNAGDEITLIGSIVSGKTYYIKGVRSNNTYYLTFTDATGSQSGTESSTTSGAIPVTFTSVGENTYKLSTPSGNYIAPGTSNGKITVSSEAIIVTASNQDSKIRLSIVSSGTTWSIQKNTSSANFGGYKNTQTDITLIEAGSIPVATTTTINATGITNTDVYTSTNAGSLSATVTEKTSGNPVEGATVAWSGNNDAVATINASTGDVTLVGAGTVTFTASYAGDEDYSSSSDTYELTVTNENPNLNTIWSEDFSDYKANDVPAAGTYGYACTNGGTNTKIYAEALAGGTSPELLVSKNGGTFSATIPLLTPTYGYSGDLVLTFKANNTNVAVSTTTEGVTITGSVVAGTSTLTLSGVTTSTENVLIKFTNSKSSNVRIDNIVLKGLVTIPVNGDNEIVNNVTIPAGVLYAVPSTGITVPSGKILTVNGTLVNTIPANLIIEDGGQLITSNPVAATVKKAIDNTAKISDVWYTIASPVNNVTPASVTNLISSTDPGFNYDLYLYDEPSHFWWNQKNDEHTSVFTNLTNGRGYLYWNSTGSDLGFSGDLNVSAVEYTLTADATELTGFNLIGNPFSHDIYKGAGTAIPNTVTSGYVLTAGFYTLTNAGAWQAGTDNSTAIKPCQGVLVQATTAGTLTIANTTANGAKASQDFVEIKVTNGQYSDVAYAVFSELRGLNKIDHLNAEIPMLYIPQNGTDYAIATMNYDEKELALNLKVATSDTYKLVVKAKGQYEYLHLIDKLTGNDIDLLATPEYTFSAKRGDGENRFRLVFEANGNALVTSNEPFAYFNGSEWVIENDGEATLQIIDVMGRMLRSENVSGNATTSLPNLSAGVYVLRLVNSESIRTQKVVIE